MSEVFFADVQRRVAGSSVTPSSLRKMVGKGGVEQARRFLSKPSTLKWIGNPERFRTELDRLTRELAMQLPRKDGYSGDLWGPARKVLNIFLGEATYNVHLRKKYGLAAIERLLELPLDSYVAHGIRSDAERLRIPVELPRWAGVINVRENTHKLYQNAASIVARRRRLAARFHLDLKYYRSDRS